MAFLMQPEKPLRGAETRVGGESREKTRQPGRAVQGQGRSMETEEHAAGRTSMWGCSRGKNEGASRSHWATSRGDHTLACPGVTSTEPSCVWGTPQVAPNGGATAQGTDQGEPFPQCQVGVCPVSREKDSLLDQILATLLSPLPNSQPGLSLDL